MANQPNFTLLSQSFETISTQMSLMEENMQPLFDRRDFQMLRTEVRQLSDNINRRLNDIDVRLTEHPNDIDVRLNGRLDQMESKMTAMDHNSNARALNSSISRPDSRLSPLKTLDDVEVVNFPESINAIKSLSVGDINGLLGAYGLDMNGTIGEKSSRLIHYIGVHLL